MQCILQPIDLVPQLHTVLREEHMDVLLTFKLRFEEGHLSQLHFEVHDVGPEIVHLGLLIG